MNKEIKGISLNWGKKNLKTTRIVIFFRNGFPFLLKAIFLFTKTEDWFAFLSFMNLYSKERGLSFQLDI